MKRKRINRRLKHQRLFGKLDPQLAALWSNRDGSGSWYGNGYGDGSGYGDGTPGGNGRGEDYDIPRTGQQEAVWDLF